MNKFLFLILPMLVFGCAQNEPPAEVYKLNSGKGWNTSIKPADLEKYIKWEKAIDLIYSGKVESVAQSHNLVVNLIFHDGSYVSTIEPDIDTVFMVIDYCGEPCKNIGLITE